MTGKPMIPFVRTLYWTLRKHMAIPFLRRSGPIGLAVLAAYLIGGGPWTFHRPEKLIQWAILSLAAYLIVRMLWENFLNIRPLNSFFRYFAVVDILDSWKPCFSPHPTILEVGSGPQGLGHLISYPFWGCDVAMNEFINPNMRPVLVSGTDLPFESDSFDVVVSLDTLEHLPTEEMRQKNVDEMWRVAKKALILGFAAGPEAYQADAELYAYYRDRNMPAPEWLHEHMAGGLPPSDFIESRWDDPSQMAAFPNEPVRFHLWLMKREAHPLWFYGFIAAVFLARPLIRLVSPSLSRTNHPYRKIYVLAKDPQLLARLKAKHRGKVKRERHQIVAD